MNLSSRVSLFFFLILAFSGIAQDEDPKWTDDLLLRGYVKNLTTAWLPPGKNSSLFIDNLIHNRFDFAWYLSDKLTFNASMRNRLFFGESAKTVPELYDMLEDDPGLMDLSKVWFNDRGAALHTILDRLNFDYQSNNLQVIVGRQRVNWGTNLIWNPNDIFNSYQYFDFDYEERIGVDAILSRYYLSATSSIEVVAAPQKRLDQSTFAARYKVLVGSYDIQAIGGYLADQIVIGGGWSGDISGAGFRGEASLFVPFEENAPTQFVGAIDIDYTFNGGWYLHGSYLFNSEGIDTKSGDYTGFFVINNNISAQTLSPAMHNIFVDLGYTVSPIVQLSLASWLNPSDGSLFLGPSMTWSVANNMQVLINVQGFIGEDETLFGDYGSFYYLRFKYSF